MAPKGALSMQHQGTEPAHEGRATPSQRDVETWIVSTLINEDSFSLWMREELVS